MTENKVEQVVISREGCPIRLVATAISTIEDRKARRREMRKIPELDSRFCDSWLMESLLASVASRLFMDRSER